MHNFTSLAQKLWIFTPNPNFFYLAGLAVQLNLRSSERSKLIFDCRNGFLGVDYIC